MVRKSVLLIMVISLALLGCSSLAKNFVVFPKAPYPYDSHQKDKTCDYYLYHLHYQGHLQQK